MRESIREEGIWWLPKGPRATRSSGTLIVDEEGMRLVSVIGPIADAAHSAMVGPEVILGRNTKGKLYTCFKTLVTNRTASTAAGDPLRIAQLEVVNLWRGQHFKKAEALAFKEGVWRYSNLQFWMHEAPGILLEGKKGESYLVKSLRKRGALWEASIGDGITVANDFTFTYSWKGDPPAVDFLNLDGVRVRSPKKLPFTQFHALERRFRALVNLLADCQLEIIDETFRAEPSSFGEAKQIGRQWAGRFAKREDPMDGSEAVSFSSIKNFSKVIETWFAEHEKLEPIANLYLQGKHNTFLNDQNQFLGIMQALEAFHRRFHPGEFMPAKDYASKVASLLSSAIPAAVIGDFRERLKSSIKYGYEYSLARRINELVKLLPRESLFDKVRDKGFRRKCIESRNAFTHQISDPSNCPLAGADLYYATLRWREALLALILQRLGLGEATIITAAKRLAHRGGSLLPV